MVFFREKRKTRQIRRDNQEARLYSAVAHCQLLQLWTLARRPLLEHEVIYTEVAIFSWTTSPRICSGILPVAMARHG